MLTKKNGTRGLILIMVLTLWNNQGAAASGHDIIEIAQLPMQQQTSDPHLRQMLEASVAGGALTWETPQGWNEAKGGGMRMATFTSQDGSDMECSIVSLKGEAGGVQNNILRWLDQIGLEVEGEQLTSFLGQIEKVTTKGDLNANLIDFTTLQDGGDEGADSMMACILQLEEKTVFIKMTGSLKTIKQNKESFRALVMSMAAGQDNSYDSE